MKTNILIYLFVLLFVSCEQYESFVDDNVTEIMDNFYLGNLRLPINAADYCYRSYLNDSVNDFTWSKLMSKRKDIALTSYEAYNAFHDSLYSIMMEDSLFNPYLYYQYGMRHNTIDLIRDEENCILIDKQRKYKLSTTNNIWNAFEDFHKGTEDFSTFIMGHMRDWNRISEYQKLKVYTSDSLLLNIPESILDSSKAYNNICEILNIHADNCKIPNSQYYIVQYSFENGLYGFKPEISIPNEIVENKTLCHYLDSIIKVDERISFMQFALFFVQ